MSVGHHVDNFSDIIQDIKNKYPNIIIVAAGGNGGNYGVYNIQLNYLMSLVLVP